MKILWRSTKKFLKDKKLKVEKKWRDKKRYLEEYSKEIDYSKIKYEDLAPNNNAEKCDEYCKALEWAIENQKVNNIALTGPYGSGKSSILRTFENQYVKYNYLNISLASFYDKNKEGKQEKQDVNEYNSIDSNIEKGILQQLFYKVDSSSIPYTRFRKIGNIRSRDIVKYMVIITITIILGMYIFEKNKFEIFINSVKNLLQIKTNYLDFIMHSTFIFLCIYIIVKSTKYCKSMLRINSFSLKLEKAELNIESQSSESIFNKYLDEILYFFEATKYNVVVIEDLDRFDNTRIFIKLRELNQLINNYEKINRRIVFVYAVKDDMFKNDERTKFFDFIIPVIPIINPSNSCDKLLEKINQDDMADKVSREFINGVSVYIEDMRMLTNIANEYIMYKSMLIDIDLKSENILALIIYKNLYPTDFSKLQYNRGLVYEAFENKKHVIESKVKDIEDEINSLELKIDCAESDYLLNVKELKYVFLRCISQGKNLITRLNNQSIDNFLRDEFDIKSILTSKDDISYHYSRGNSYEYDDRISVREINERSNSRYTFEERFENIKYKNNENKDELKSQIECLRNDKRKLKSLNLYQLIDKYGAKEVLKEDIIKEKSIVYLLRHGKIDETYMNYLTYFYGNYLTAKDMNFISTIRNHEGYEFEYELSKIEYIISQLNDYEFEQKEILNFSIFEFMLQNSKKYVTQLEIIMKQISNEDQISVKFIDEFKDYIEERNEEEQFWNIICESWSGLWKYITTNTLYSKKKINSYLLKIIEYVEIDIIRGLNKDNDLVEYIENSNEFLPMVSELDISKVKNIITDFAIEFNVIEVKNVDKELLDYIWDGCYYDINKKIIDDILIAKYGKNINNINQSNLTTIRSSDDENLIKYIEDNISYYMNNVFLEIEENTKEDISVIVELLNLEENELNIEIKEKIINKEEFELLDIEEVPKILWDYILSVQKLKANWDSVVKYKEYFADMDETLINYLNDEKIYTQLSQQSLINDGLNTKTFRAIVDCESISDVAFSELVKSIEWIYSNYDTGVISKGHVNILVDNDKFEFNVDNYNSIREHFDNIHIKFIERNFNEYIDNIELYITDSADLCKILKLDLCTLDDIQVVISKINLDLEGEDILDEDLAELIYTISLTNWGKINLGNQLYWKIYNNLDKEKKIRLLANQSIFLDDEKITESIKEIGEPLSNILLPRSRERIDYSKSIFELATSLDKCNYISSKSIGNHKLGGKYIQFNARNK